MCRDLLKALWLLLSQGAYTLYFLLHYPRIYPRISENAVNTSVLEVRLTGLEPVGKNPSNP